MNSSNCCFLTCKQISQEAGQVVWYSHLFQNFPQFIVIHTVKGFGIVNKAEIDVFLELSSLISLSLSLSVQFSSVQSHSHVFKPSVLQIPSNWIPCLETDYFNILFFFFSPFSLWFLKCCMRLHYIMLQWRLEHMYLLKLRFSPGICPGVVWLGHMVILFLVFLRRSPSVHHSGSTSLHAHWQCKRVPCSPHTLQKLFFVEFLVMAIPTGVK